MKYLLLPLLLIQLSLSAQWSIVPMLRPNVQLSATSLDGKIYLAGGNIDGVTPGSFLDIYDVETESWEERNLSESKLFIAAIASEDKVVFGGGLTAFFPSSSFTNRIEVYDPFLDERSIAFLSERKMTSAAISGDKVFFGGGITRLPIGIGGGVFETTNIVDIYDLSTGEVTQDALSEARGFIATAAANNVVLFAGGVKEEEGIRQVSSRVDIYHTIRDEWTTAQLSEARGAATAIAIGNKIIIAGGNKDGVDNPSAQVDIYDTVTEEWTTARLATARGAMQGAVIGNKVYFVGGGAASINSFSFISTSNAVDIYDAETNTWTTDEMIFPRINHAVASSGNQLFIAGGLSDVNEDEVLSRMEVFTDTTAVISSTNTNLLPINFEVYSNPTNQTLTLSFPNFQHNHRLHITNMSGQLCLERKVNTKQVTVDISKLPKGVYALTVVNEMKKQIHTQQIFLH